MDHHEHAQHIYAALIQGWMSTHSSPGAAELRSWAELAWQAAKVFDEVTRAKK